MKATKRSVAPLKDGRKHEPRPSLRVRSGLRAGPNGDASVAPPW